MPAQTVILTCRSLAREVEQAVAIEHLEDVSLVVTDPVCETAQGRHRLPSLPSAPHRHIILLGGHCQRATVVPPEDTYEVVPDCTSTCAHLLLPGVTVDALRREGAYLVTPGWLATWMDHLRAWGCDQAGARRMFAECCDHITLLDTLCDDLAPQRLRDFAAFVDRPAVCLPVGLDHLRLTLLRHLHTGRETRPRTMSDQASASFQLDIAQRLTGLTSERSAIDVLFGIFEALFGARRLAYLPSGPGAKSVCRPSRPCDDAERQALDSLLAEREWVALDGGFALAIKSEGELLCILVVADLVVAEHRDRYLNLAISMAPMIALAITNARRYEQILQEQTRYRVARSALDQATELVLWIGPDGRVVDANDAARARLGQLTQTGAPLEYAAIDTTHTTESFADLWSRASAAGGAAWTTSYRTTQPSCIEVEVTARVVSSAAGPVLCAIGRDIGERLRAEAERREYDRRLQAAARAAGLGALASGVAHQFNNLLATILTEAEMASGERSLVAAPLVADSLRTISDAARRGGRLCRRMLACSGQELLRTDNVDLAGLVQRVADEFRASGAGGAVIVRCGCQRPTVQGDGELLRQVIQELVQNAFDASGPANLPPELVLTTESIPAGFTTSSGDPLGPGEYVKLDIIDQGSGMPSEVLQRLFEPFFSTRFAGRGLGLAASRGVALVHQGGISVLSQPEIGTTVSLYLPAQRCAGPATPVETAPISPFCGLAIVVDDEPAVLRSTARIVRSLGFDVIDAATVDTARHLMAEHAGAVRLAIVDVLMPGMNGVELLAVLRSQQPGLPALLVSGHTGHLVGDIQAGGATMFLAKPFGKQRLAASLRTLLAAGPPIAGEPEATLT